MQAIKNSVQLLGHLGKDVEIRTFQSGIKKAQFSMATTERYKDNSGSWQERTQWHNIVAWGKTAELMASSLQKGSRVALSGKLEYRQYTSKDGLQRNVAEINATEFMTLREKKTA
jgi:single-strand DNA-binding protein